MKRPSKRPRVSDAIMPRQASWRSVAPSSWALLLAVSLLFSWPLLSRSALPRASDVSYHAQWAHGFTRALGEGVIYPRWIEDANRGYGAPVFIVYPPLAHYGVAAASLVNDDIVASLRLTLIVATLLSALSFFLAIRDVASERAALVGAALYVLLPYHALDLYDRFALAEFVAFAWLPWLFRAVRGLARGPSRTDWLALVAAQALLILTHLMTAYLALFVLAPYAVVVVRRSRRWPALAAIGSALVIAALASAVYLVPLLLERHDIHLDWLSEPHYDWRRNFIYRDEVAFGYQPDVTKPWATAAATAQAVLAAAAAALLAIRRRGSAAESGDDAVTSVSGEGVAWTALSVWVLFLQTPLSTPLWAYFPGLESAQFPWRFGTFQVFGAAALVACVVTTIRGAPAEGRPSPDHRSVRAQLLYVARGPLVVAALLALAAVPALFVSARVTKARPYVVDETVARSPLYRFRPVLEYLPRGVEGWRDWGTRPYSGSRVELTPPGQVATLEWTGHRRRVLVETTGEARLRFRTFDFAGWRASVDGNAVAIRSDNPERLIEVRVPPGRHNVVVEFGTTPARRFGALLSGVTVLALAIAAVVPLRVRVRRWLAGPMVHPEPITASARWLAALWTAAAAVTFWSFGFTIMRGGDLWWHLAAGRLIWTTGSWPRTDSWSFTRAGAPWLHHEWLSDVVYNVWVTTLGTEALAWWKWIVVVGAFVLLYRTLVRLTGDFLSAYLASLLAIAVGAPFFDVRPHLYSILGYVVVLRLTLRPSRATWALPAVFLVWANLHGGFFFGLLAMTVVFGVRMLKDDAPRRLALVWLACVGVCLVTPNGLEAFGYPLKYAFDRDSPFRTLGEWLPPFRPGGIRAPLLVPAIAVFVAAAVAGVVLGLHRMRAWMAALALTFLTLAMAVESRRFVPLFAISLSPVLALALAQLRARSGAGSGDHRPLAARLFLPVAALVLGAVWLAPYPLGARAFATMNAEGTFPVETVNWIETNGLRGDVFALYNWGGYLHWRTDGRLRVHSDGRADTVFDAATYRDYLRVLGMQPGWVQVVERSPAQYFLWPSAQRGQISTLLRNGHWRLLYQDEVSVLLGRGPAASLAAARPSPDSAHRRLLLAAAALDRNDLAGATASFEAALALSPSMVEACYGLARVEVLKGNDRAAEATLARCERIYPDRARRRAFHDYISAVATTRARAASGAGGPSSR
jgi:6-pyruvoyl-tetrahydropterin synthase-like protein/tetratricopeptide repeat protein